MIVDHVKRACFHSWTVGWAYTKAICGAILIGAPYLSDQLNDSRIQSVIPPPVVGKIVLVIAVITFIARVVPHFDGEHPGDHDEPHEGTT